MCRCLSTPFTSGLHVSASFPVEVDAEVVIDFGSEGFENEFDMHYGLLPPGQTVLVRTYTDDTDDLVLAEIQPKFIVMFEPNMEFIRRVEVRH